MNWPLVNTWLILALLAVMVVGGVLQWLALRRATPLAIRAEVDRVAMSVGTLMRAQRALERGQGELHHEQKQGIHTLHVRVTDLSTSMDDRLKEIRDGLSALKCSEKEWMAASPPGFCPLRKVDCPLEPQEP